MYYDCTWGIPEAVTHMKSGILVGESDPEGINRWLERPAWCDVLRESLGRGVSVSAAWRGRPELETTKKRRLAESDIP